MFHTKLFKKKKKKGQKIEYVVTAWCKHVAFPLSLCRPFSFDKFGSIFLVRQFDLTFISQSIVYFFLPFIINSLYVFTFVYRIIEFIEKKHSAASFLIFVVSCCLFACMQLKSRFAFSRVNLIRG